MTEGNDVTMEESITVNNNEQVTEPPSKTKKLAKKAAGEFDISFNMTDEELAYEEDILRNPYVVKGWLRYAEYKRSAPPAALNMIYERAVKQLPGSYKLWIVYLKLRKRQVRGLCITDPVYEEVNNTFERSLVFMFKMPRIWLEYLQFLVDQQKITRCRHAFDRALRSLPVTQHTRVWKLYLKFIQMHSIPETCCRVWRRYLKLERNDVEDFITYLISIEKLDEAAVRLADIVNNEDFHSKHGKSKFQLWMDLCNLLSKHPFQVTSLDAEAIIRQGISRFTDQRGQLWNALADYYIRAGLFDRARDIYMEAVKVVVRVRDFTQVFDAYVVFEESLIKHLLSKSNKGELSSEQSLELELMLCRFEEMILQRPMLLNSVLLRQNPHNVSEWLQRVKLLEGKQALKIVKTYQKAIKTVDPQQAFGKLSELYLEFAKYYISNNQLDDARTVFEKAVEVPFKQVEELANIWCEYAEMEINVECYDRALKLMQRATTPPPKKAAYFDTSEPPQNRVYRSLKIWSLYADLEESMGTFKTAKAVYDAIIDLRIATPQIVMNYAVFLEENNYFEDSFKAYEKGISLFKWPNVSEIWNTYLVKFTGRYKGQKLERTRDLFEQCLDGCPPELAKNVFLLYAKMEEEYGMARHAMAIYDRSTSAVSKGEQMEMFEIYLQRAAEIYGVTYTRQIYEKAIETLPADEQARAMCLRFADLETKLGEIDRARAIYAHCSQMCDPRVTAHFWAAWKNFEVRHGNEDTLREMLRIKRSVQAIFNTKVNYMTKQMLETAAAAASASSAAGIASELQGEQPDDQQPAETPAAESAAKENILFVRGSVSNQEKVSEAVNDAEIDLDSDEEAAAEDGKGEPMDVVKRNVPTAVFGSLLDKTRQAENN